MTKKQDRLMTRKKFVRISSAGLLGVGLLGKSTALSGKSLKNQVEKNPERRMLGRTGITVTALGYGIYTLERSQEGVAVEWGCDGLLYGNALYFWQDRYYVKIMAYDIAQETDKLLSKIAGSISRKLPDVEASPKQLAIFPENGRIKDSDRYIKTDVLGQDYFHDGFRMEYDRKGQRWFR